MPVTNDKFDQQKIDKLKHLLENMAGKGQPKPYEIYVDSLKVVPKTEDPKEFDSYEYYVNEDTEKIKVVIYNSNLTPRNEQFCFHVQQNKQEKSLNGLGEIDNIIQEKLTAREREIHLANLKQELETTKQQLEEAEEYAEQLEEQLEEAKSNKYKLGSLDLVDLAMQGIGRLAEKNADLLSKVGLEGFATSNQKQIDVKPVEETQASFQRKTENSPQITPEHLQYIPVLQQLDAAFDKSQFDIVMQILAKFSADPDSLTSVAELLNIQIR